MSRRSLSIFLVVILSLPTLYKTGFFAYFQLNRDFLAQNYCVNRSQPITMCYGQCFLSKGLQLAGESSQKEKLAASPKTDIPQFIPDFELTLSQPVVVPTLVRSLSTVTHLDEGATSSLLRPPIA